MIYFDNAATSWPKPRAVFDKMREALKSAGNPGRGSHEAAMWSAKCIYQTREKAAKLFNVSDPLNIAFTSNGTESLNFAINLIDGEVVTTSMEHNSVLRPCYARCSTEIVPADDKGNVSPKDILNRLTKDTKAVVMTHVSNVTGTIYDVAAVGRECRNRGILFIVDGAQSAGIIPVDVDKSFVDIYCFTGHKGLLGPQGTGGIYIAPHVKDRLKPFKMGGTGTSSFNREHPCEMPEVVEAGTLNTHGIAALGAGIDYVMEAGPDRIWAYESCLANVFAIELMSFENVTVYGDLAQPHVGIVSVNVKDKDSSEVGAELSEQGICVRCGTHCAPLAHDSLGTHEQGVVRFSFGYHNTLEEVYKAVDLVGRISIES